MSSNVSWWKRVFASSFEPSLQLDPTCLSRKARCPARIFRMRSPIRFQFAPHLCVNECAGNPHGTPIHSPTRGRTPREKASLLIVRLSTARLRNISLRARIVKLRGDIIGVASWMERGKNSPSQADIKIPPSSNEGRDRYESFNRGYCYGRDFESLGIRFFTVNE